MMGAVPVVASNTGGLSSAVSDGQTGFLVPPGDIQALSASLLRVLKNRSLTEQLGRAGRERAMQEFAEDAVIDQFVELYRQVAAPTPPTTGAALVGNSSGRA
jgi:glycosyltransferase involved in cell wall biosynthesis